MLRIAHKRLQQGNAIVAIIGLVAFLAMGVVGYMYLTTADKSDVKDTDQAIATSPEDLDTSDWELYTNEEYGVVVSYPSGWYVFRNERSGAAFNFGVSNYNAELYPTKADSNVYDVPEDYATFYVSGKEYKDFIGCEGIETDTTLVQDCVQDGRMAPATAREYEYLEEVLYGENTYYKVKIRDIEDKDAFLFYSFNDVTKQAIVITTYIDPETQPTIEGILSALKLS